MRGEDKADRDIGANVDTNNGMGEFRSVMGKGDDRYGLDQIGGNMPRYMPTPLDRSIEEVYKDWVHANDGCHIDASIVDSDACKAWRHGLAVTGE